MSAVKTQSPMFSCLRCRRVTTCPQTHTQSKDPFFHLRPSCFLLLTYTPNLVSCQVSRSQCQITAFPTDKHGIIRLPLKQWSHAVFAISRHANIDKPDTLTTANCLPQCYCRPSFYAGPQHCSFIFVLNYEQSLTTMPVNSVNRGGIRDS